MSTEKKHTEDGEVSGEATHPSPRSSSIPSPRSSGGHSPRSDSDRQPKPYRNVDVDPRSVPFTYGHKKGNIRQIAGEIAAATGSNIFMKYITPPNKEFGFWKISSYSEEALEQAWHVCQSVRIE